MARKRWSFSETLCLTRCAHHYPGVHLLVVTSCPPCSLDSQIWLCLRQTPLVNMLPLPNWDFTILPRLFQQWTHITLTMDRRLLINTRYFLWTMHGWGRFYVWTGQKDKWQVIHTAPVWSATKTLIGNLTLRSCWGRNGMQLNCAGVIPYSDSSFQGSTWICLLVRAPLTLDAAACIFMCLMSAYREEDG